MEKDAIPKKDIPEKHHITQNYLLKSLVEIVTNRHPIILESTFRLVQSGKKFNCYSFMHQGNSTILIGTYNGVSAVFIPLSTITNYIILDDEKFEKTPITVRKNLVMSNDIIDFVKSNYPNDFIEINHSNSKEFKDKKIKFFNKQKECEKERFFKEYYLKNKVEYDYSKFSEEELKQLNLDIEKYWLDREKEFYKILK